MTATVIGIAVALPAGLYVLLGNVDQLRQGLDTTARLSLYLEETVDDAAAEALRGRLEGRPGVASATLITRDQALDEYRRMSGFGEAVAALDHNPLPAVVVVTPAPGGDRAEEVDRLAAELGGLPEVELAQYDLEWLQRLQALSAAFQRGVLVLAGVLALAVLLIVGNTIRLAIHNRRDEIEVAKLVGATDAFVRRPFLYLGLWLGLAGALLAWALVGVTIGLLQGPAGRVAALYQSGFSLTGLGMGEGLVLVAGGGLLGLAGAWVAVAQHLGDIQPG
jgi:cell division transport system permease protein